MTVLTHRFTEAIDYARVAHGPHFRKGTRIPSATATIAPGAHRLSL